MYPFFLLPNYEPQLLAQVIVPASDGTGTQVNQAGNQFNINGGTLSGDRANLFHSFDRFGLSANQIANFMANPNLQNILGRVVGGEASVINGLVQVSGSNANLFLMNPAGIVFGANAQLNLRGAFTATTANGIKFGEQWFNAAGSNNYVSLIGNPNAFAFTTNQAGAIVNAGNLVVADGQALSLVGGTVVNTGNLTAPGGEITIAAVPGSNQVQINQTGVLLGFQVTPIGNNQPNPSTFTPSTLPALLTGGTAIPATGMVVNPDGTVQLTAGGTVIPTNPGTAIASGNINVVGQRGGNVGVLGDRVGVSNGTINASGINGGGTVLIGGDYQGKGTVPNATETTIDKDATIRADALTNGNGGKIIAWADQTANIHGTLTARGGGVAGDGGLVETSGKQSLNLTSLPDASAPFGKSGTWLIDPTNITIVNGGGTVGIGAIGTSIVDVANINAALNSGTSVTITTDIGGTEPGDITQTLGATISKTAGPEASLTLIAARGIFLRAAITSTSNALNLNINAGNSLLIEDTTISSNGGVINLSGNDGSPAGLEIDNSSINSGGGAINLVGRGSDITGIRLALGAINSGGGNIRLQGSTTDGLGGILLTSLSSLNSNGGNIDLTGSGIFPGQGLIQLDPGSTIASGLGNLTITANRMSLGVNANSLTGTGNLTLQPFSPNQPIVLGGITANNPNSLELLTNDLDAVQNGFNNITIGSANGTGLITVAENTAFNNSVTLRTPGGNIIFNGSVTLPNEATLNFESLSATTNLSQDITNTSSDPLRFYGNVLLNNDIAINSASDIRFANTLNGDRQLALNSNGNVQFGGAVGGNTPLKGLTISSSATEVAANLTTSGDIQFNGAVNVSNNATIKSNAGSISATGTISGLNSAINLSTPAGRIAVQNLSAPGNPITVMARDSIKTGAIDSANLEGNGGNILLDPQGDIEVGSINAQGSVTGVGGNVDITTASLFRATDTFIDRNSILASISTAGGAGNGSIIIRNGGGLKNTPFTIGDATANGTAGAITTGETTLAPTRSLRQNFREGKIQIISTTDDFTRNLIEPEQQPTPQQIIALPQEQSTATEPGSEPVAVSLAAIDKMDGEASVTELETDSTTEYQNYFSSTEETPIKTVTQTSEMLKTIEKEAGIKPAIVYISFSPSAQPEAETKLLSRSEFSKSHDQLELILVTSDGKAIRKAIPGATRSSVQTLANQFRDAITNPIRRRTTTYLHQPASKLYRLFVAPLEAELQQQNIQNLTFILDRGLRALPIGALYDPTSKSYLIEKYSLGLMPTLSLTDTRYVDIRNSQVLAMGASQFSQTQIAQSALPAVPLELKLIERQWQATPLSEDKFTIENLVSRQQQSPFGIIHLATHASFQPGEPSRSYIQFADKALSLGQLQKFIHGSNSPIPPELVVLSACRTAFGSPEAELGFAGAALQAQVKTVLASLWSVNDTGAAGLMAEFYHQLKTAPIKAEALRQAQIAMLRGNILIKDDKLYWSGNNQETLPADLAGLASGDLSHPYYWSAFTLIGSPW